MLIVYISLHIHQNWIGGRVYGGKAKSHNIIITMTAVVKKVLTAV